MNYPNGYNLGNRSENPYGMGGGAPSYPGGQPMHNPVLNGGFNTAVRNSEYDGFPPHDSPPGSPRSHLSPSGMSHPCPPFQHQQDYGMYSHGPPHGSPPGSPPGSSHGPPYAGPLNGHQMQYPLPPASSQYGMMHDTTIPSYHHQAIGSLHPPVAPPSHYHQVPSPSITHVPYHPQPPTNYTQPLNPPAPVFVDSASPGIRSTFRSNGNKRALLIGINYSGQNKLNGCVNDVVNMHYLLSTKFGFKPADFTVMTDEQNQISCGRHLHPTRANILKAMRELVANVSAGDSLFLQFSGHGGQIPDSSNDEHDGFDEVIFPVDYETEGPIIDDESYDILVRNLPAGVRLTVLFDCCHSGTGLDLPYNYDVKHPGSGISMTPAGANNSMPNSASAVLQAQGPFAVVVYALTHGSANKKKPSNCRPPNPSAGETLLFSGCADSETAADVSGADIVATGAMTYAFIEAIERSIGDWHQCTYQKLLNAMRQKLKESNKKQIPQFSCSHHMDLSSSFII